MALSSPGVQVSVIDESFYTPAEPGTVPLIIVASAENKANGGGTGTAPGTIKANAGTVYLLTSQKDLADTFGDPVFKTDANNNPIHAGEQNEYGLQAAYSLLGVSNRAYVVRADVDLDQLTASADEPTANPAGGTHWLDLASTKWGIFEWNGAAVTTTNGQTFANKLPTLVIDINKVDAGTGAPISSVGAIGDYALVTVDTSNTTPALTTGHPNTLWYKNRSGAWVKVGTEAWAKSWPVHTGTTTLSTWSAGQTFTINGTVITAPSASTSPGALASVATAITNAGEVNMNNGFAASVVNGRLEIYGYRQDDSDLGDSTLNTGTLVLANGSLAVSALGLTAGTYYTPKLQISKHTEVPQWKTGAIDTRPSGSVWIKTTNPNLGADWNVKRWNSTTLLWETVSAPLYANGHAALYGLDSTGGGASLSTGALYVKYNYDERIGDNLDNLSVDFKLYRRAATGATTIRSVVIDDGDLTVGANTFSIAESLVGSATLDAARTISFTATVGAGSGATNANLISTNINAAGFTNIIAEVDSQNRLLITHTKGGDFRLTNGTNTPLTPLFSAYDFEPSSTNYGTGTANLYAAPTEDELDQDFVASLWHPLVYVSSDTAPGSLTEDGTLWYSSVIDEVDLMVHDGTTWVGLLNYDFGSGAGVTDPNGPIISATTPERNSENGNLVTGDIWIDTSDLENFPTVYKYNNALPAGRKWVLMDTSDQSTEDGILFADARYSDAGNTSDVAATIVDLLSSDYLDPDAPDPALYPQGMLLWNLRRSGFNVKRFVRNYIDTTDTNARYNDESMSNYYEHRWVTESPNQVDGTGSFGRKSQRAVVVKALQASVNSNEQMRDEESRVFNLIACPGYPELIGEMITLNTDRGLTAFVVGDTPARLTSDATSLLNWASNANGAVEDNDIGAASYDEYMAMFYPWGFSSDNFGNNIAVPPSHMMLRTIALNDQVAYPWFAPAGVRRGGITNATAVGYITSEGEFSSVALNTGQRDTLYEQKINPLTFFTGTGLVNYGQKTRARAASSLDRINVARLVVYLRRQLNQLAKPYIFEPNDKITRDEIKAAVESLLLELVGQRAIYDYIVVCDESNNTPSRIDRNELYIDIAIEPVKAVEFIYIPLRLKNTGEIASLG